MVPHSCHIHNTASDMDMLKNCPCLYLNHDLSHCKCVLCFCDKCPTIPMPIQEENIDTPNTYPKIRFHVYRNISYFILHSICPY